MTVTGSLKDNTNGKIDGALNEGWAMDLRRVVSVEDCSDEAQN
jgi:hypothetical protein